MSYPSVEWFQTSATIGGQPIAQTEATAKHNVGQRIRAKDLTYGEVEFIYLPGVASCADAVTGATNATSARATATHRRTLKDQPIKGVRVV